jgi:hypothetical protein
MSDKPVTVAVLGIDHRHAFSMFDGMLKAGSLAAGWWTDGSPVPLEAFIEQFPSVPRIDDYRALLDRPDVDMVLLASVPSQRARPLRKQGYNVRIVAYANGMRYARIQQDFVGEKFGVPLEEAAFHADVMETACMLVIRPDLVRMERAEPGWIGDNATIIDRIFLEGLQSVTPNGIMGDPRRATAEMGEALLEHLSQTIADELRPRLGWD